MAHFSSPLGFQPHPCSNVDPRPLPKQKELKAGCNLIFPSWFGHSFACQNVAVFPRLPAAHESEGAELSSWDRSMSSILKAPCHFQGICERSYLYSFFHFHQLITSCCCLCTSQQHLEEGNMTIRLGFRHLPSKLNRRQHETHQNLRPMRKSGHTGPKGFGIFCFVLKRAAWLYTKQLIPWLNF